MRTLSRHKRAGAVSEGSEEWFSSLLQNASDIITLYEADGSIRYVSPAIKRVLGYDPEETVEELRGMHVYDFVSHDHENIDSVFQSVLDEGHRFIGERRYRRKDGSVLDVETSASTVSYDGTEVLCTVVRDVTGRKRAEEMRTRLARQAELRADISGALAESAALRSTLQRCAEAMVGHLDVAFARIWTLNEEENVLELQASAGLYTHLDGAHSRVPVGEYKIGLIAQERRPHLTNEVPKDPHFSDREWGRREGMVAFAGYPLVVEGRLVGVVAMFSRQELAEDTIEALGSVADGIAQGIERKRAEEALHQSEERFRALVQNASDVIAIIDTEGTSPTKAPRSNGSWVTEPRK